MRKPRTARLRLLAVLGVLAIFAAGCGDDDETSSDETTETTEGGSTASTMDPADVPEGGTLVWGAEQEPDCMDWIASCSGSSWGYWMANVTTLPRAFAVVADGDGWKYEVTSLLTEAPELDTSGDKPVVTYNINPDAVWSDGEPITSADFAYTWDQIATGEDIYDKTGYTSIESVDSTDPAVAVVTFSENFAPWQSLFGGGYGILPAHILEGGDRSEMMANGYDFSGGPWIATWNKGVDITLEPNPNWWGDAPKLEKVVFQITPDTDAEFQAFTAGEVLGIYPQPQPDVVDQIEAGLDNAQSQYSANTGNLEALWINNEVAPFDVLEVRQALAYSIDRAAIVEALFGPLGVTEPSQSLNPPILAEFSDQEAFSGYTLDLEKASELMTTAGYEKNADGVWEKDGETASFTINSTTGNARRELTEEVLQGQLTEAGFEMTIENKEAGDLFGEILPAGDYQVALYAQVATSLDPGLCVLFCSKNIPSEENEFSGQNWQRVNIPEADPLMETLDVSLDNAERAEAGKQADAILAENMISLPLDPLPNILIWSDSVVGPIGDNPVMGPFYNIDQWGVTS